MATSNKPNKHDHELLSAYVDGVGELTPEERRAIELELPALRADADATRELLASLRELPDAGTEPAWNELAKRISAEVGERATRAWWRRLLVPMTAAVALAAGAVLVIHMTGSPAPEVPLVTPAPAPVAVIAPHPAPAPSADAVYLDGEAVELGALGDDSGDVLGDLDDAPSTDDDIIGGALLPTPDLAWIDDLDSESLAVAERWLVERKGT